MKRSNLHIVSGTQPCYYSHIDLTRNRGFDFDEIMKKKEIYYPAELTFKSIFHMRQDLHENITLVLLEQGIDARIDHKPSKNSKFISYTITAEFDSEDHLEQICACIASVDGFIMMF